MFVFILQGLNWVDVFTKHVKMPYSLKSECEEVGPVQEQFGLEVSFTSSANELLTCDDNSEVRKSSN
jgi:hypothetical protein